MSLRLKSKEGSKKASPPEPAPSYMDSKQFAAYLASLRDNRVNRPGGARPLPEPSASGSRRDSDRISTNRISLGASTATSNPYMTPDAGRPRSSLPSLGDSAISRLSSFSGRDYYPEKPAAAPLKPNEIVPSATYMERGRRWMEKEEAYSLRSAMDDMDLKNKTRGRPLSTAGGSQDEPKSDENEDETRLYNAALDEAAELVWQHQHGVKPPEPGTPYRYKPHLRKDSYAHARTASIGRYGSDIEPSGLARNNKRSGSGSSSGSEGRPSLDSSRVSLDNQSDRASTDSAQTKQQQGSAPRRPASGGRRRSSMLRNISGEIERPFSGDQIWEEPESDASKAAAGKTSKAVPEMAPETEPVPLRLRLRNPLKQAQPSSSAAPDSGNSSPGTTSPTKPFQRIEIYRNPPSQSRNPNYTSNIQRPAGPRTANDSVPRKHGVEIRGDDIRQATSFRLGDRSAKLPTPSAVSDRPGRPIVSFDANWTPPDQAAADVTPEPPREPQPEPIRLSIGVLPAEHKEAQQDAGARQGPKAGQPEPQQALPPIPSVSVTPHPPASASPSPRPSTSSTPSTPSISIGTPDLGPSGPRVPVLAVTPDDSPTLPSIQVSGEGSIPDTPVIVTPDDNAASSASSSPTMFKPSTRPLPTPSKAGPHARHVRGGRSHWSPAPGAVTRATAVCHECGFPIEGRFVALHGAKERFHPQCFACYTCGTSLEALEISPEPDAFRAARLERIARRAAGEALSEERGKTEAEDGDARLRFYCHLDWHELFAPRCKHCTTPILGEHIVALGEHWHYGHFFCAECGDPFEHGMTHIEKDGYAWCINCQTKRTERRAPKCKRCRKAVIGQYVQALGGEWHDECFRCATCGGGFDDGQVFPAGDRVLCKVCRMRELKA